MSDAELRRIVQYIGQAQLSEMFGEGDSFNTIKAWVEKESSTGQLITCRQSLRAKLSPFGMEGNTREIVVIYGASSKQQVHFNGG